MARATFAPAPASSPVPGLCRLAHFLCAGGPRLSAQRRTGGKVCHQKLLSDSSSICGDLPGSSRTRARRTGNFFSLDGEKEMSEETCGSVPSALLNPLLRMQSRFPQFVLETEELKKRRILPRCCLKCALVGSTGSPPKYHLTQGMGTSTFCSAVRFCKRSCNFALF